MNEGPATVAVIIPTYNRSALLAESLKSIARQTRAADYVVVVDDGSTDDTAAVVQEVQREFFPNLNWPSFRYIGRTSNDGKAVAVNEALADLDAIDPDLVWIFDDDDIADPLRLGYVVPFFEEDPKLDVVHTSAEYREDLSVDGKGNVVGGIGAREYWTVQDCPDKWALRFMLHGCKWFGISVMWRYDLLDRLFAVESGKDDDEARILREGFARRDFRPALKDSAWPMDPRLERAQDYDLWLRFLRAGATSKGVDRTTVYARAHDGDRGIGHRLNQEAVGRATAESHRTIFEKLKTWPIETIFPGIEDDATLQSDAHVELAYAFGLADLWDEALAELKKIEDPTVVRHVHRDAISRLIEATGKEHPETKTVAIRIRDAWDDANAAASDDPGLLAASIF